VELEQFLPKTTVEGYKRETVLYYTIVMKWHSSSWIELKVIEFVETSQLAASCVAVARQCVRFLKCHILYIGSKQGGELKNDAERTEFDSTGEGSDVDNIDKNNTSD